MANSQRRGVHGSFKPHGMLGPFKPIKVQPPPHFGHEPTPDHQPNIPPPERSKPVKFSIPLPERSERIPDPSKREHAVTPKRRSRKFNDPSESTGPGFGGHIQAGVTPFSYTTPGD